MLPPPFKLASWVHAAYPILVSTPVSAEALAFGTRGHPVADLTTPLPLYYPALS